MHTRSIGLRGSVHVAMQKNELLVPFSTLVVVKHGNEKGMIFCGEVSCWAIFQSHNNCGYTSTYPAELHFSHDVSAGITWLSSSER